MRETYTDDGNTLNGVGEAFRLVFGVLGSHGDDYYDLFELIYWFGRSSVAFRLLRSRWAMSFLKDKQADFRNRHPDPTYRSTFIELNSESRDGMEVLNDVPDESGLRAITKAVYLRVLWR